MKIVIVGKDSYIGAHIKECFICHDGVNEVIEVDARDDGWREFDFSDVDVVIHVAAIVHNKTLNDWEIYHQVNTMLPVEVAGVAKKAGVKQFIFLSTMGVSMVKANMRRSSYCDAWRMRTLQLQWLDRQMSMAKAAKVDISQGLLLL